MYHVGDFTVKCPPSVNDYHRLFTPKVLIRDVADILSSAEEEKKRKYCDVAYLLALLAVSVGGVLAREAECFIKLLTDKIAIKCISRSSRIDTSQAVFCNFEGPLTH